jgi:cytochrome P450
MCVLLLFAGHGTTTHLIGNAVLAVINWPSEFDRLRREPALMQRAVEEFLRFDSPVQATGRRATLDMEIPAMAEVSSVVRPLAMPDQKHC